MALMIGWEKGQRVAFSITYWTDHRAVLRCLTVRGFWKRSFHNHRWWTCLCHHKSLRLDYDTQTTRAKCGHLAWRCLYWPAEWREKELIVRLDEGCPLPSFRGDYLARIWEWTRQLCCNAPQHNQEECRSLWYRTRMGSWYGCVARVRITRLCLVC